MSNASVLASSPACGPLLPVSLSLSLSLSLCFLSLFSCDAMNDLLIYGVSKNYKFNCFINSRILSKVECLQRAKIPTCTVTFRHITFIPKEQQA